jgi:hypothetical protein
MSSEFEQTRKILKLVVQALEDLEWRPYQDGVLYTSVAKRRDIEQVILELKHVLDWVLVDKAPAQIATRTKEEGLSL